MEEGFAEAAASAFTVETHACAIPGVSVLKLTGDLDMAVREELRGAFASITDSRVAVLDVSAVSYADSTAISELIRFRKALLAAGGSDVCFVGPGSSFERILQLTDLTKVFPVFATLDEALAKAQM